MTPRKLLALMRRPVMRRVSHSVATGLAGQLALVASGVILARSLGVHDRGRLAVLVLTVSLVIQPWVCPTALTYAMARGERVGWGIKSVGGLISLQLTAGLAIEAMALLAIEHRWHGIGGAPIVSALALTLAGMLQQYGLAVLQGARRFRAFNICRTLPAAGFSALAGVTVLFIHIDLHLSITLLALTGATSAVVTITTVFARPLKGYNETTTARKLLRFGARALLGSSSPVETLRLDQAVVGLFLSASSLGYTWSQLPSPICRGSSPRALGWSRIRKWLRPRRRAKHDERCTDSLPSGPASSCSLWSPWN